jgi:peptide chain release factor 1
MIIDELENLEEKYRRLTLSLSDPALISAPQKIKEIAKERAELEPLVKKYEEFKRVKSEIRQSEDIIADKKAEPELRSLAEAELKELHERELKLEEELKLLLLPKDPYDEKNVFLEIRAGAGGDESSLFAQDLFRMYSRYAESRGWQFEVIQARRLSPTSGERMSIHRSSTKAAFTGFSAFPGPKPRAVFTHRP